MQMQHGCEGLLDKLSCRRIEAKTIWSVVYIIARAGLLSFHDGMGKLGLAQALLQ